MSLAKLALAGGLMALVLSACGIAAKPIAGTPGLNRIHGTHALVDNFRSSHAACLRAGGLSVHLFRASGNRPGIQIDAGPGSPMVIFDPTPGGAQYQQMIGEAQGAEVIGSALVYPNQAPDSELQTIEGCVAQGVKG
jgi:hypothetical protein